MSIVTARRVGLVALPALLCGIAGTAISIWTFDPSTTRSADAAIVLGASTWKGKPSPVFAARIEHGIDLYKSGRVSKLVFSGGTGKGEPVSLAESAREYALQRGVNENDILIEPYSRITRENLLYSRQIAEAEGIKTFLIVSDPLHMKRAMRLAGDLGLTAWPSATPSTMYQSLRTRLWFLKRETYFYIQYILVARFINLPTLEEAIKREHCDHIDGQCPPDSTHYGRDTEGHTETVGT